MIDPPAAERMNIEYLGILNRQDSLISHSSIENSQLNRFWRYCL